MYNGSVRAGHITRMYGPFRDHHSINEYTIHSMSKGAILIFRLQWCVLESLLLKDGSLADKAINLHYWVFFDNIHSNGLFVMGKGLIIVHTVHHSISNRRVFSPIFLALVV